MISKRIFQWEEKMKLNPFWNYSKSKVVPSKPWSWHQSLSKWNERAAALPHNYAQDTVKHSVHPNSLLGPCRLPLSPFQWIAVWHFSWPKQMKNQAMKIQLFTFKHISHGYNHVHLDTFLWQQNWDLNELAPQWSQGGSFCIGFECVCTCANGHPHQDKNAIKQP